MRARISAGAVSNYENEVSMPPAASLRRITAVLAENLDLDRATLWEQFGQLYDAGVENDSTASAPPAG